jgi:hypothetical protein
LVGITALWSSGNTEGLLGSSAVCLERTLGGPWSSRDTEGLLGSLTVRLERSTLRVPSWYGLATTPRIRALGTRLQEGSRRPGFFGLLSLSGCIQPLTGPIQTRLQKPKSTQIVKSKLKHVLKYNQLQDMFQMAFFKEEQVLLLHHVKMSRVVF